MRIPNPLSGSFINPQVVTESMSLQNNYTEWLKRGRQRAAVAQVLRKPMTPAEICAAARNINPRIQLRDVWLLMQQFVEHGLVICLGPDNGNGRLYSLSERGRAAVLSAFGIASKAPSKAVVWRKYSWVVRARARKLTLRGLGRLEEKTGAGQTATQIRKGMMNERSVNLNQVIRALRELLEAGLVERSSVGKQQYRKLYCLTSEGGAILNELKR